MIPPTKIGRIPRKIVSGFAAVTADEWKHWILIYSLYSLYEILPEQDYQCWCLLVEACRLLSIPVISEDQIQIAHDLLVRFCKCFESLYGVQHCTPNMHMACHLKDCMLDYGPLSSFWCFPFERFNGTLENFKKSWVVPEKQMFRKFLDMQLLYAVETTQVKENEYASLIMKSNDLFKESFEYSSFHQSIAIDLVSLHQITNFDCSISLIDATKKSFQVPVPPLKERCFNDDEYSEVKQMYQMLYPNLTFTQINRFYLETKRMIINKEEFISSKSRSQRSSVVAAHWPRISAANNEDIPLRIGLVLSFYCHDVRFLDHSRNQVLPTQHTIARIKWYLDHPCKDYLHPSIIISSTVFDPNMLEFIPVSRIAGRAAVIKTSFKFDYGDDDVIIAVPLLKKV